eukprot:6177029-Pleurochrysis_carterae.AAC.1
MRLAPDALYSSNLLKCDIQYENQAKKELRASDEHAEGWKEFKADALWHHLLHRATTGAKPGDGAPKLLGARLQAGPRRSAPRNTLETHVRAKREPELSVHADPWRFPQRQRIDDDSRHADHEHDSYARPDQAYAIPSFRGAPRDTPELCGTVNSFPGRDASPRRRHDFSTIRERRAVTAWLMGKLRLCGSYIPTGSDSCRMGICTRRARMGRGQRKEFWPNTDYY